MTIKNIKKTFKPKSWERFNVIEESDFPNRKFNSDWNEDDLVLYRNTEGRITRYILIGKIDKGDFMGMGETELDLD